MSIMLKIAVGHSEDVDTLIAVETVLEQCRRQPGTLEPQAGIILAGIDYEHRKILTEIHTRYPEPFIVPVGDVTGHGIEAALLMTTARALIRSRVQQPGSIAQLLTEVNQHLAYDIDASGRFMTMFYLNIDPRKKCLKWVRAGHDPAIFYDPATDIFEELGGGAGIPLGVDNSFAYEANEKSGLAKDQIIFIGTDGIWETHNPNGEMFGKKPVYDIIRANATTGPQAIIDEVILAMNEFRGNLEPQDDATLVAVKVTGEL